MMQQYRVDVGGVSLSPEAIAQAVLALLPPTSVSVVQVAELVAIQSLARGHQRWLTTKDSVTVWYPPEDVVMHLTDEEKQQRLAVIRQKRALLADEDVRRRGGSR